MGDISTLPVKKSVLGLHNPATSENDKYTSLLCASDELIGAVKGEWIFELPISSRWLNGRGAKV